MKHEEKPLLVQLNWHKDDREGRFLLRRIDEASRLPALGSGSTAGSSLSGGVNGQQQQQQQQPQMPEDGNGTFKRKLSKREKKELKKQEKLQKQRAKDGKDGEGVAEKLYTGRTSNHSFLHIFMTREPMWHRNVCILETLSGIFGQIRFCYREATIQIDAPVKSTPMTITETAIQCALDFH